MLPEVVPRFSAEKTLVVKGTCRALKLGCFPGPASVLILACRMESAMKRKGNHGKPSFFGEGKKVWK